MRTFVSSLLALVGLFLLIPNIQAQTERSAAQSRKGTINGHVTDSSGGVLQGAQVTVDPEGLTAVSDTEGQFFLNNLEPGSYTITVTYVGFAKFTQTVNVTPGQATAAEAKLGVESQNLEVLVTGERPSAEAEAINV